MKQQVINGLNKWVSSRIDELAVDNVLLSIASGAMKVGVKNMISNIDMSMVLPFITKDGIIDAHIVTDEITKSINAITPKEVRIKGIPLIVGNGMIKFQLPEKNWIGDFLGVSSISLTANDLDELANMINNEI